MKKFSAVIPFDLNNDLISHLIRKDKQEDLVFALWNPSEGNQRFTALIKMAIWPKKDDRNIHGNVSFNASYFKRVCSIAVKEKCGIALLHSHIGNGWQAMSTDDILAELKIAETTETFTGLPLVGLTVSRDGMWSARVWSYNNVTKKFKHQWANNVRIVGKEFDVHYTDSLNQPVIFEEYFKRTAIVWGQENHKKIARLNIGIVGLGSVGSMVAESLARMGMQNITLIDFDTIEKHNLDRLVGSTKKDLTRLKTEIATREIKKSATAQKCTIIQSPYKISKEIAYRTALDCDIIFSCVDKPRARYILNHLAFNHLIPIIDGGLQVRFNNVYKFIGCEWQVQTVTPNRPCLECLNAYDPYQVALEKDGLLEDPSYLKGLPLEVRTQKNSENIFPFSMNLASMEIFQFIEFVTKIAGVDWGTQRYRFSDAFISNYTDKTCKHNCSFPKGIADGDKYLRVYDL